MTFIEYIYILILGAVILSLCFYGFYKHKTKKKNKKNEKM